MPTNRQTFIYTCAYIFGIFCLMFQAASTVYQLGATISDSQRIAILQQQRQQLMSTKTEVEQQAAALASISAIDDNLPAGYTPVSKPLVIRTSDSVASR